MSAPQSPNTQQPVTTWTEPPWCGWIETTGDALLILEAARRGLIPRVTRRLVDSERKMITSGSVFVFDEDESGIKRWTDGFFWSPSRILGNFLLYRETDKRGSASRGGRSDSCDGDGAKDSQALSRPKSDSSTPIMDKARERSLLGSLTNSYKFKSDGLMKKTFSLTVGGAAQHLISYYKVEDINSGRLRSPSSLPELASLDISPEYLDKTHFRNPPKVELGPDGVLRYRGEADDIDTSPPLLTAPLSGLPLLTDGRVTDGPSSKRTKRYDPYSPSITKRSRKQAKTSPEEASSSVEAQVSPDELTSPAPQPTNYPDPNLATLTLPTPYPPYGLPPYYQVGYHIPSHFAPAPYPPNAIPPPIVSQQSAQYAVHSAAGPTNNAMNDSNTLQIQQYYPYYHPPHPTYSGYPGVAWSYAGYPPHPMPHLPPPSMPEGDDKTDEGTDNGPDT